MTTHFPPLPAGYELAQLAFDSAHGVISATLENRPTLVLVESVWRVWTPELFQGNL